MNLPKAEEWTDPGSMDAPPRRGRRALAVAAFCVVAAVGSFLVWRATSLLGLPKVGSPFDLEGFAAVEVPDDDNAFTYYRAAVARYVNHRWANDPLTGAWGQKSQQDRDWFFANGDAIKLWMAGTNKERSLYVRPRDVRIDARLDVAQDLRSLNRLALIAAQRMQSLGEPDEAWPWYRAALRCSRQCGKDGTFIERLIGIAMYTKTAGEIRVWADQPNLSKGALRQALDDVIAINATTPTFGENLRVEYLAFSRLLDDPDASVWQVYKVMGDPLGDRPPALADRLNEAFWKLARREPERSRRAMDLAWANWLSVGDLPEWERRKRRRPFPAGLFFDPPLDAPPSARLLTPDKLNVWVRSTRLLRLFLPAIDALEKAQDREAYLRASLVVHLAEELYARDHGKPPASPQELVGPYLPALPEDYVTVVSESSPTPK